MGFIFFATLCSYNFYWLVSKRYFSNFNLGKEAGKISLLLIAGVGTLICFMRSELPLLYVLPAVGLTVLYTLPLLPFKFLNFTRRFGVLKTIVLSLSWMYVTAYLPVHIPPAALTASDGFICMRRFLFMLMLCIIFDSRDSAIDKIRGMRSLATDLSPKALRIFIWVTFIALFATNFFYYHYGITAKQFAALQVSALALLIAYYFSTKKQGYFFYYFIIDGLMLFSALTTFVASI
ncbi:hypothetical protein LK994_13715 [Ferruginibacter lapsinanis]|uniref:hypothetical protein n=1 Tax=Ferruginibacter lapsinanis TaxID=563172 RepID=UPI001E2C93EC|nr:hypothetical protein [Ferruginibacter lapsinanis]UEG49694.1 hypothetical protein LK994_13715 [Ferruginibacter lapsinanis]